MVSEKMNKTDIAKRLRGLAIRSHNEGKHQTADHITELADELDPPRPEPGTVVWWRKDVGDEWRIGTVYSGGVEFGTSSYSWDEIEYKPARIAGPM